MHRSLDSLTVLSREMIYARRKGQGDDKAIALPRMLKSRDNTMNASIVADARASHITQHFPSVTTRHGKARAGVIDGRICTRAPAHVWVGVSFRCLLPDARSCIQSFEQKFDASPGYRRAPVRTLSVSMVTLYKKSWKPQSTSWQDKAPTIRATSSERLVTSLA